MFEPFGEDGQKRLESKRALIVGCGALGGSVANILVRGGIGSVGLIDPDVVELGNLHRQFLFSESDIGRRKVDAARETLLAADRNARIDVFPVRFDAENVEMLQEFDLLIDGTDNFPTRFLMNEAALRWKKPLVSAGVYGASGQIFTVFPGRTACLACLASPIAESESEEFPVFPPIVQTIAAWEASEAIKILSGNESAALSTLIAVDLWTNRFTTMNVPRNERCPVCGLPEPSLRGLIGPTSTK